MKIDFSDIAGTLGARGSYQVSEHLAPTEAYICIGPATGEITVENTGSLLLVRGQLCAAVRLSCVRCLGEFERRFEMEIEEEFATEDTHPDVHTIDRDEPEASAMSECVLDVTELARQQLVVNIPMASVCRPDCRGMCPQCGQNLNDAPCGCPSPPADSRWGRLQDFLRGPAQGQHER